MEIKSYNKAYLPYISDSVGIMFETATSNGINPNMFWNTFINSNVAKQIEIGNIIYLNKTGTELLNELYKNNLKSSNIYKNCYYWAGWALTQFQYETSLSFERINMDLSIDDVLNLYPTLHEANITKFIDVAKTFIKKQDTINLKKIRIAKGLSQSQLAKLANVDIRSIQMYEQKRNDINKAQGETLYKLAKVLGCNIEDLLDY